MDTSHNPNQDFEINCMKYQPDKKALGDPPLHNTATHFEDLSPFKCNPDPMKQLE